MTPTERKRALDYLHETRQRMLETIERLSPEQLRYKPAPDRWSVAECLEHVIVVEGRAITRIADALQRPADPSKCSTCADDESLVRGVEARVDRLQAPEPARPTAGGKVTIFRYNSRPQGSVRSISPLKWTAICGGM